MTKRRRTGIPWSRTILLATGATVSAAVLGWSISQRPVESVQASAEGRQAPEADDATVLDNDGRFTGPGEVWPPQPRDATEVVTRNFGDLEAEPQADAMARIDAGSGAASSPSELVAASAEVQAAIGERHNVIAVEATDDGAQMVYYSLSNNQTVEVVVASGAVASVDTYAANVFQPELSVDEKQAAVDIARAHWQTKRDARIDSLQGFSILTFQPGGSYYDTRMVYVSFHVDEDARPELLAWVDLASGDVVESKVDR